MRILITGAGGFVGRHASREFATHGHEVHAMDRVVPPSPSGAVAWTACDLNDCTALASAIRNIQPEACLHLAGLTHVPAGWSDPKQLFEANVLGAIHLLEAFRSLCPAARLLVVSTAQVYGTKTGNAILHEDTPLSPDNLYAVSKAAADQLVLLYAKRHGLHAMTVRPNNHIGPGQSPSFVVPALARQVRAVAKGANPAIRAGNLESGRDFTDVRDVAEAYRLLIEKGHSGIAYNLGSGHLVGIGDILDRLCRLADVRPQVVRDEQLYRPTDNSPLLDTGRLKRDTGWEPRIDLQSSLRDILADQA